MTKELKRFLALYEYGMARHAFTRAQRAAQKAAVKEREASYARDARGAIVGDLSYKEQMMVCLCAYGLKPHDYDMPAFIAPQSPDGKIYQFVFCLADLAVVDNKEVIARHEYSALGHQELYEFLEKIVDIH